MIPMLIANADDLNDDDFEPEESGHCVQCSRPTSGDVCEECGLPLCPMCSECGAGFYNKHPSPNYQPSYMENNL